MKRRDFIALGAALAVTPAILRAAPLNYTPGLVQQHLADGDVVFLDFKADWCTTCRAQERVIQSLKAADPSYDAAITFINVDWDQYGDSELSRDLNIPRRSTLVALKGDQELGRIVAGTSQAQIQELMDIARAAAG